MKKKIRKAAKAKVAGTKRKRGAPARKSQRKGGAFCLLLLALVAVGGFLAYHHGLLEHFFQPPARIDELSVHFIDIGQGDAILIMSPGGTMLIDGGPVTPRGGRMGVVDYIRAQGIRRLDYVVATHPHLDHIGALPAVLSAFEVGRVIMPDAVHTTLAFERLLDAIEANGLAPFAAVGPGNEWSEGTEFSMGDARFTIVGPTDQFPGSRSLNDWSVVLHLQYGRTSFLFTGDMEREGEAALVAAGRRIRADVLQAPHHGSRSSSTEAFIDAVAPAFVAISVGEYNTYGTYPDFHPHQEVLDRFAARGVQILRTDERGTIRFRSDGVTVTVD